MNRRPPIHPLALLARATTAALVVAFVTAAPAIAATIPTAVDSQTVHAGGGDSTDGADRDKGKGNDRTDTATITTTTTTDTTTTTTTTTTPDPAPSDAAPTPQPSPSSSPVALVSSVTENPDAADHNFGMPTTFGTSLKTSSDIHLTASSVAITAALSAAFVLLFAIPAELLRSTLAHNYARFAGWLAVIGKRRRDKIEAAGGVVAMATRPVRSAIERTRLALIRLLPWITADWAIIGLTAATGALILSFADPHFGFHEESARLLLAVFLSVILLAVSINTIVRFVAVKRFHTPANINPMPAVLIFMAVGVLVSRLTHFQPGFLIGVVMGVTLARELGKVAEAQLAMVAAASYFGIGVTSWFIYGRLAEGGEVEGFWPNILREVMAAGTLEAFIALVVGLLPMAFMEGRPIYLWSRRTWAVIYVVVLGTFVTLVVPMSGHLEETSGNFFALMLGFVLFAAVAVGFWYLFHTIEEREAAEHARTAAAHASAKRSATSAPKAKTTATRERAKV